MLLNIVYAYINKDVIFNKSHITLLLKSEFISDRLYNNEKNEYETYFSDRKLIQIV